MNHSKDANSRWAQVATLKGKQEGGGERDNHGKRDSIAIEKKKNLAQLSNITMKKG